MSVQQTARWLIQAEALAVALQCMRRFSSVLVGFIISVFAAPWIHPLENLGFFAAICGGKKDLCVCSTNFETEEEKISKVLEALKRNLFS